MWPSGYTRRLERTTIERVHSADLTPTTFDFALWRKHRSPWRYVEHLATLPASNFLHDLSGTIGVIMAIAVAVGLYESGLEAGVLPRGLPNIALAAAEPAALTSSALSLLLVFRTNACYQRW